MPFGAMEMTDKIPHQALIVVADGGGARFFRNTGQAASVTLSADGAFGPTDLESEGPSGKQPRSATSQETDEATFSKQLAHELYRRAQKDQFSALVLIADPETLGEIRPLLHKEVRERLIAEHAKTFTKASLGDIQKFLA